MDRKVEKVLGDITRNIPEHLRKVTETVVDNSEEERVRAMAKYPSLDIGQRRRLERLIATGAFAGKPEEIVDEDKVAELDRYHENAITAARKAGRLPDPKDDPFVRKRDWMIRNRKKV